MRKVYIRKEKCAETGFINTVVYNDPECTSLYCIFPAELGGFPVSRRVVRFNGADCEAVYIRSKPNEFKGRKGRIVQTLVHLNNHYGRGDVMSVDWDACTFVRRPFNCRDEVRRFRVVGDSVHALGHQRKIV